MLLQSSKKEPENYRPIRLDSFPGRAMKQLFLEVISMLVEEKMVIRSSEHEFTKKKPCLINVVASTNSQAG